MAVTPKRCKVNFATMFGSDLSEIHLFLDGVLHLYSYICTMATCCNLQMLTIGFVQVFSRPQPTNNFDFGKFSDAMKKWTYAYIGDGHQSIDRDWYTQCKDSHHGMDEHTTYTMFDHGMYKDIEHILKHKCWLSWPILLKCRVSMRCYCLATHLNGVTVDTTDPSEPATDQFNMG